MVKMSIHVCTKSSSRLVKVHPEIPAHLSSVRYLVGVSQLITMRLSNENYILSAIIKQRYHLEYVLTFRDSMMMHFINEHEQSFP